MRFPGKIIFLLLFIISFSCITRLEKEGWQRIAIVTQLDTTITKKENEVVVEKSHGKNAYFYRFNFFKKDSSGNIINREATWGDRELKSDFAYYKWESDTLCYVKLVHQGDVDLSLKFIVGVWSGMEELNEPAP